MERRLSLVAMLLLVAASHVIVLQLPPLVSAAGPRRSTTGGGSYSLTSPGRSKQVVKFVRNFLRKNWVGVAMDIIQFVVESSAGDSGDKPPPPANGSKGQPPVSPTPAGNSSEAADSVGLYYVKLLVGSPAQTLAGVVDISSQLVWMQCDPCTATVCQPSSFKLSASRSIQLLPCTSIACQNIFATSGRSCAYANDACTYYTAYGSNVVSSGYFVSDTFTIDGSPVQGTVFGCTAPSAMDSSGGVSGVIGLGRGPLSLVSQLLVSNFSYTLGQEGSIDLQLGNVAAPRPDDGRYRSSSTRLLRSRMYTDLYYVGLAGIRVDGEDLAGIPPGTFDLRSDGSGGVSLSTTVPVTFLVEDAYKALRRAFVNKIPSTPVGTTHLGGSLDLCYAAKALDAVKVPSLTLVFRGEDAAVELKSANYLFNLNDGQRDLTCLTVLPSRGGSMLGSLMQTGMQMVFDIQDEQLTFVTEQALPPSLATPRSQAAWLAAIVVPVAVWWSLVF